MQLGPVTEHRGARRGLGRKPGIAPGHAVRMALYPFEAQTSSRLSRFWGQDGAWLDQNGYGTCVAFAAAHRIADKPVYARDVHPDLFTPSDEWAFDLYRDATGDETMQNGTWMHTVADELMDRGLISRYETIGSAADLEYALLERGPICVGIPWYESMFNPRLREDGKRWLKVDWYSALAGYHEIDVNGIRLDVPTPFYRIKQSWGQWWGDGGNARIPKVTLEELLWGGPHGGPYTMDAVWLQETR